MSGFIFPVFLHLWTKWRSYTLESLLFFFLSRFLCAWSSSNYWYYCVLTLLYWRLNNSPQTVCLFIFSKPSQYGPGLSFLIFLACYRYGELSPSTFPGKLIGGLCALCGIFILTLPIPIVVNRQKNWFENIFFFYLKYFYSFASYYKNRLWRNEVKCKAQSRVCVTPYRITLISRPNSIITLLLF